MARPNSALLTAIGVGSSTAGGRSNAHTILLANRLLGAIARGLEGALSINSGYWKVDS